MVKQWVTHYRLSYMVTCAQEEHCQLPRGLPAMPPNTWKAMTWEDFLVFWVRQHGGDRASAEAALAHFQPEGGQGLQRVVDPASGEPRYLVNVGGGPLLRIAATVGDPTRFALPALSPPRQQQQQTPAPALPRQQQQPQPTYQQLQMPSRLTRS